jgi:DivIVA domain-containing protein
MLTTADVEQKTFSTALRGYDLDEVDDFLDEVVATIKGLTEQIDEAKAGQAQPAVVTPAPAPAQESEPEPESVAQTPSPGPDEAAIGRAIIAAQAAADRLMEDAQSEASRIVDEAKGEAETLGAERDARRQEVESEISALAARVA